MPLDGFFNSARGRLGGPVASNIGADYAASARAESASNRAARQANDVEERIDKLTLINWAMWTLLMETTSLTEKDLLQRVKDLDMLDGKTDNKATRQIAKCDNCGRTMSPRHSRCLYCGHEKLKLSAFDAMM